VLKAAFSFQVAKNWNNWQGQHLEPVRLAYYAGDVRDVPIPFVYF